jgi:hypothetical protein
MKPESDFLGMLFETGSVMGACEAVGMSRKSAYQLRARAGAESFAAAWDAALGEPAPKVTSPAANFFACNRSVQLVMFRGRYRGAWRNAANRDLMSHLWPHRPGDRCLPDGDIPHPLERAPIPAKLNP